MEGDANVQIIRIEHLQSLPGIGPEWRDKLESLKSVSLTELIQKKRMADQ